jgi:hypothetical protein
MLELERRQELPLDGGDVKNQFGKGRYEVMAMSALCWLSLVGADAHRDYPLLFYPGLAVAMLLLVAINCSYLGAFARWSGGSS